MKKAPTDPNTGPLTLVCNRYGTIPQWAIVPGSTIDKCAVCESPVHTAPATRALAIRNPQAVIACSQCANKLAKPGDHEVVWTKEQKNELREAGVMTDNLPTKYRKPYPQ